jgi:hypothetical protein
MNVRTRREKVRFISGDTECAAWGYSGTNGARDHGRPGAVTKEPAPTCSRSDPRAGFAVLAFDYRRLGDHLGQLAEQASLTGKLQPAGVGNPR